MRALAVVHLALGVPLAGGLATGVPVVASHLSSNIITLGTEDSLRDAARLLKRYKITGAPVADGSSLSGILSRNDLLVAIDEACPSDMPATEFSDVIQRVQQSEVWEAMRPQPTYIHPDATLLAAARVMQGNKLNRLMAKSEFSSMLGVVDSTDVVFSLLKCDAKAAAEIDPEDYTFNCKVDYEADDGPQEDIDEECALGTKVESYMAECLYVMRPSMSLKDAARKPLGDGSEPSRTHAPARHARTGPRALARAQPHAPTACDRIDSRGKSKGLLRAAGVTGAPVVDSNDALVGVISRNDLLKALLTIPPEVEAAGGEAFAAAVAEIEATPVEEAMSPAQPSVNISPKATVLEAAKLLAREKLNRLMVVEPSSGGLCGVISSTDVVFAMLGCAHSLDEDGSDADEEIEESRIGNLYRRGIY